MKYKTTQKAVINGYWKTIKVGYCSLQYLLYFENPIAYTCGTYGHNSDVFHFGNKAIVTGYRPFGNVTPEYEVVRAYDQAAEKIVYNYSIPYEERKELVNMLLADFIKEATAD